MVSYSELVARIDKCEEELGRIIGKAIEADLTIDEVRELCHLFSEFAEISDLIQDWFMSIDPEMLGGTRTIH